MTPRPPTSTLFPYTTLFRSLSIGSSAYVRGGRLHAAFALHLASGTLANAELTLGIRSEEHTSELQSRRDLVCRLLLEKKHGSLPRYPVDRDTVTALAAAADL